MRSKPFGFSRVLGSDSNNSCLYFKGGEMFWAQSSGTHDTRIRFFFTKKTSPRPQSKRRGILFGIVELTREARIILYHDTINIITY